MYREHRIGISIPAYNEELLICDTLDTLPDYVDEIFVVNDGSKDQTKARIQERAARDKRIKLIDHPVNLGLGQSLIDGYVACRDANVDFTAVMAGDNQMDPADLPALLDKLIDGEYDYVKGNRLLHQQVGDMPTYRFLGNSALTILSKFATGYYQLMDPQCGYTVIRNTALKRIPIEKMTRGYGYNADILCMLNIRRYRVADVEVKPVYGREKSKIKLRSYIPKTSWLLVKLFFRRLWQRYVVLDFHPLVLFYMFAAFNFVLIVLPFTVRGAEYYFRTGIVPATTFIVSVFSFLIAFQSLLFATWMDMDYNRDRGS